MKNIFAREPALVIATVVAVLGLLTAFGLVVSDDQSAAIVAAVNAVLALIAGAATRSQVTPVGNPSAAVVDAVEAGVVTTDAEPYTVPGHYVP